MFIVKLNFVLCMAYSVLRNTNTRDAIRIYEISSISRVLCRLRFYTLPKATISLGSALPRSSSSLPENTSGKGIPLLLFGLIPRRDCSFHPHVSMRLVSVALPPQYVTDPTRFMSEILPRIASGGRVLPAALTLWNSDFPLCLFSKAQQPHTAYLLYKSIDDSLWSMGNQD